MIARLARQLEKEKRDLLVLEVVIEQHPIGSEQIAVETDIDEHKTRYSLQMLEDDGMVDPTPEGAVPATEIGRHVEQINEGLDGLIGRVDGLRRFEST